jgi:hypothetical protein
MELSGQSHASAALPPGKEPLVSIEDVVWAPEPACSLWVREKSCPCRESNPGRPAQFEIETNYGDVLFSFQRLIEEACFVPKLQFIISSFS